MDIKKKLMFFTKGGEGTIGPPELIINGKFNTDSDWTKSSGTLIEDGVAKFNTASTWSFLLRQDIATVEGLRYDISFDISDYGSGSIGVSLGSLANDTETGINANGHYSFKLIQEAGSSLQIAITSEALGAVMNIDNVSVKLDESYVPPSNPDAPTTLAVGTLTGTTADLTWTKSATGSMTNYRVYDDGVLMQTFGDVASGTLTGLTESTSYTNITVRAWDGSLESSDSNSVGFTTEAPANPELMSDPNAANLLNEVDAVGQFALGNLSTVGTDSGNPYPATGGSHCILGTSTTGGSGSFIRWIFNAEAGKTYDVSVAYNPNTTNNRLRFRDNLVADYDSRGNPAGWNLYEFQIECTTTGEVDCRFYMTDGLGTAGDTCRVDSFSIKEAP